MSAERGYFQIEGRWEHSRNAPGEDAFFMIDQIGGSLDDAQRAAQAYIDKRAASNHSRLEWVAGAYRNAKCYYAYTPSITVRITR
jgi:hypothetical protein